MSTSTDIFLPISFDQLIRIIQSLSKEDKQRLLDTLENREDDIPQWQKDEVNRRVEKYQKHPELMVEEKKAMELIISSEL